MILATLVEPPPGRTHAGLRADWGEALVFADLKFSDIVTSHRSAESYTPSELGVAVDGREVETPVMSPRFAGFELQAGAHQFRAEYRASSLTAEPLFDSVAVVLASFILEGLPTGLEARFATPCPRRVWR